MSAPALIVVDVQQAFDDPSWGARNNLACEANIAALIRHWRAEERPVVFVRHDSHEPGSTLAPGHPGNAFKDLVTGEPDLLVTKSVNSSFHGEPDLQAWLDGEGIRTIYVCGITTNHCCETTARVGGNLGYDVRFVLDATHTFDRPDPFGGIVTADELARVTATNLHEEFATVIDTASAIGDGSGIRMRTATREDLPFLEEMLLLAATWRDEANGGRLDPALRHYVEAFGREGDVGVIAEVDGDPAGAAWSRRFEPAHAGYGFVGPDVPELSIGVRAAHRGRGLGAGLIDALKRELIAAGFGRVSLSVEPDNPARRIYERAGFQPVGANGGSWTMVCDLAYARPAGPDLHVSRKHLRRTHY
jgi:nicotinamidase-related amidase/ribosomal protein S18 acetylase RimI-like enzyme